MRSSSHLSGLHRAIRIDFLLTLTVCSALLVAPPAQAQTFTVLHAFKGMPDGAGPDGGVILDAFGNVYGTAFSAGVRYKGIAFKIGPEGKETILYNFLAGHGANPDSTLVEDANGVLYGTTERGGAYNQGAVFKLGKKGHESVLYSFRGGTDGAWPNAVMRGADGDFYGTTEDGGNTGCDGQGCGTVFKLSSAGKKTTLYTFTGGTDGALPVGGLVQDSAGNLYGVTRGGGNLSCNDGYGCGTVFEVDAAGTETVVHRFIGGNDGIWPAGLIRDQESNLYGTTSQGGLFGNGTVFKLDPSGQETVLYSFTGGADGAQPDAGVVLDATGNIYGTATGGGAGSCDCGVAFVLEASGKETVLHSFTGGADGAGPGGVILDASGNIYGTAGGGGDLRCGYHGEGCGTVFKITP
jgi:uncharacterized repeat protein (TIGR03803 family)